MIVAATGNGPTAFWYFSRGSGFAALVLLTLSVAGGVLISTRYEAPDWPRFVVQDLHRRISLLVVVFLTLHIVTAVVDPFAHLGPKDALVPFSSAYRPVWLGLGVVATELLVALILTSLVRHRIGFRAWKLVHWLAYACWPLALVHGVGTGTDTRSFWGLLLDLGCVAAVVLAAVWRLSWGWPGNAGRRVLLGGLTGAGLVALAGWALAGPLRPGWARAAGTPEALLAASGASPAASTSPSSSPTPAPTPTPVTGVPAGLREELQGTVRRAAGGAAVVDARTTGSPALALTIDVPSDDAATAPRLTIAQGGQTLCSTTLSEERGLTAVCDQTVVRLRLEQSDDGGIVGVLSTEAGR